MTQISKARAQANGVISQQPERSTSSTTESPPQIQPMRYTTPSGEHIIPYVEPKLPQRVLGASGRNKVALSSESEKALLGDLHDDRVFLQELANEPAFYGEVGSEVHKLVLDGLKFLDSRIEFWSQKNPLISAQNNGGSNSGARDGRRGSRHVVEPGRRERFVLPAISSSAPAAHI